MCATAFVLPVTGAAAAATQQNPTRVSARPACATCRLLFTDTFSIGKPNDPTVPDFRSRFAITAQHFLATGSGDAPIAVYDKNGRFLSSFGRLGSGPGEFRYEHPWLATAPGDSLYVSDNRNILVFSPARRYVRTFTTLGYYHFVVLGNGRIVVSGSLYRESSPTTFPIHLLTNSGGVERSFGSIARIRTRCSSCLLHGLAPGANSSVWVMAPQRQELTRWDLSGRMLEHILLTDSPWFRAWDAQLQSQNPGRVTRVLSMSYDESGGILWIARLTVARR